MPNIIDIMPTLAQVADAQPYDIVAWHLFLRPTMSNDELPIVKAIARRYDALPDAERMRLTATARRLHG